MKIKKLYISSFGGLSNFSLDFDDGLNIFYGGNENGKTTVMAFIKMMFYGSSARGNDPQKNPRKKYLPWSGEKPAGSITFEYQDKCYTIERQFGTTSATDKISIIDESTGQLINVTSNTDLGLKFFSLSESAFERCLFIGQLGNFEENASANYEISQKLANLADTGEEDTSLNTCIERLEKAKFSIISKGKKSGVYDKNKVALENLRSELEISRADEIKRKDLALAIENEKRAIADLQGDIQRLTALLKTEEAQKEYEKLNDYVAALETVNSCTPKIKLSDGRNADLNFVEDASRKIELLGALELKSKEAEDKVLSLEKQVAELKEKVDLTSAQNQEKLENTVADLTERKGKAEEKIALLSKELENENLTLSKAVQKKSSAVYWLIILAVIGISLGFAGIISGVYMIPGIALGALSVLSGLLIFLIKKSKISKQIGDISDKIQERKACLESEKKSLDNCQNEITAAKVNLEVLKESSGSDYKLLTSKLKDLKEANEVLTSADNQISEIKSSLKTAFSGMSNADTVNGLQIILFSIKDNLSKLNKAEIHLKMLKTDFGDLSLNDAKERLKNTPGISRLNMSGEEIASTLEFKKKQYDDLKAKLAYDTAREKTEFVNHKNPTELEHIIDRLTCEMENELKFHDAAQIAIETLNSATALMRKNFGSLIEKRTTEILSKITEGNFTDVRISNSLDIAVNPKNSFGLKPWHYLSSGTVDQAYFALRLAVSEILSKDTDGFPLFIDDAFCQYDDERTKKAMEFLTEYSLKNQVSLFTCHGSYSSFGTLKNLK